MSSTAPALRHSRPPAWLLNPVRKTYFRDHIGEIPLAGLATVCHEARCPNRGECLLRGTLTFMILGEICTRSCPFCAVRSGRPPRPPDPAEPDRLVRAIAHLGLRYVVLTSPNRDELPDGGAGHYARCVRRIREAIPGIGIEILAPDFLGRAEALDRVLADPPDVFAHDLQTVPRLYRHVRPGHRYERSLGLFAYLRERAPALPLKAGIMVGFGESAAEVEAVMRDFAGAGGRLFTIGQYLQPGPQYVEVAEYVPLSRYEEFRAAGRRCGLTVQASPLTRSSYLAEQLAGRL